MKAITLWQPWAQLIAAGHKRYETRSWATRYRGNIAIHSASRWTKAEQQATKHLMSRFPELQQSFSDDTPPLGCVVAACRLVKIHRVEDIRHTLSPLELAVGNYADGRFAWELEIVRLPPQPIAARGQQGIWEWNP